MKTQNEYKQEITNFISKNPNSPVYLIINAYDICDANSFSDLSYLSTGNYAYGEIEDVQIGKCIFKYSELLWEDDVDEENIDSLKKAIDFIDIAGCEWDDVSYRSIYPWLGVEKRLSPNVLEKLIRKIYNTLPWETAMAVYITLASKKTTDKAILMKDYVKKLVNADMINQLEFNPKLIDELEF